MKELRTTNILLLLIVIPLVFYLLKILSFIFIPLVFAMFFATLFLPMLRWMKKKGLPKILGIAMVILIIVGVLKLGGELIKISSNEIRTTDGAFFEKAEEKVVDLIVTIEAFFGVERLQGETIVKRYFEQDNFLGVTF